MKRRIYRPRGITKRQLQALDTIHAHIREHGTPPTIREMGLRLGITSTCSTYRHIQALERKGLIERLPNLRGGAYARPRGLRLTAEGQAIYGDEVGCCPHCGGRLEP
jgi:SOS-response transcriptional repressor LexA